MDLVPASLGSLGLGCGELYHNLTMWTFVMIHPAHGVSRDQVPLCDRELLPT